MSTQAALILSQKISMLTPLKVSLARKAFSTAFPVTINITLTSTMTKHKIMYRAIFTCGL